MKNDAVSQKEWNESNDVREQAKSGRAQRDERKKMKLSVLK